MLNVDTNPDSVASLSQAFICINQEITDLSVRAEHSPETQIRAARVSRRELISLLMLER